MSNPRDGTDPGGPEPEGTPDFLSLADALELHKNAIESYGGSTGIRDMALLKSALAMPRAGIVGQFLHGTLHEMAAAYLFHLVQNHPFIDGNKRVGALAAFVFLAMNGLSLEATEESYTQLVLDVSTGCLSKSDVATFFQANCVSSAVER